MWIEFDGVVIWSEEGTFANAILMEEIDLNGRTIYVEELGDRKSNIYRDTKSDTRRYTITLRLYSSHRFSTGQLTKWWEELHSSDGGEREIRRKMDSGRELVLMAVPETPQWSDVGSQHATVTQSYVAATPFWRDATESSASTNFAGVGPVLLSCTNTGSISSWLRFRYAGATEDPKIAYLTEWEIEFDLNLAAGDVLDVDCKTPASAWYDATGAPPAVKAYGYRTVATSFRKAKLPPGTHDLSLTAVAGSAGLLTAYWYNWYESAL